MSSRRQDFSYPALDMPIMYYRYEDRMTSPGVDDWGDRLPNPSGTELQLCVYKVTKITPRGVILDRHRFVRNDTVKQYACATIEDAKISYRARKAKQISIYTERIRHAEKALAMLDSGKLSNKAGVQTYVANFPFIEVSI